MRICSLRFGVAAAVALASGHAAAAGAGGATVGVAVSGGIDGLGLEVALPINAHFGVRAMASGMSVSRNGTYGTSDLWNGSAKFGQYGALLDYYPFAGAFRLSTGVVYDANKISINGSQSGSYTFGGQSYSAGTVGTASGTVSWNKFVPYLGIGAGNLAGSRGWHTGFDLGVLFTGSPAVALSASCSAAGVAAGCNQAMLNQNVAAEQANLQNDVSRYRLWPVARVDVGYAF